MALQKRRWIYACQPVVYGMSCDKCSGTNITWSEFVGHIWCYNFKLDTLGNPGIFDGPIPISIAALLGMSFDRISLKTGNVIKFRARKVRT